MNTIIEKIRAEIERKKDYALEHYQNQGDIQSAYNVCKDLLSVLSDLEKECEEKPTTAEGLEEEIERYLSTEWELDEDLNKDKPIYIYDCTWEDLKILARHFAQWQKEKDERTLRKFFNDRNQGDASFYDLLAYREGHRDGMDEQKEQMMKEAVEGVVSLQFADGTGAVRTTDGFVLNGLRCGQKVPVIIVKED